MRPLGTLSLLLWLLPFASTAGAADPAHGPSHVPALSVWLTVDPADARIARLASGPPPSLSPPLSPPLSAPLSRNAPGLLLTVEAGGGAAGTASTRDAVRAIAGGAHRAGWRWGLALTLPDVVIR
ncbi:MAG TPA: hypothetical protein VF425_08910, partial [Thermoanaerobaculia bacterium]